MDYIKILNCKRIFIYFKNFYNCQKKRNLQKKLLRNKIKIVIKKKGKTLKKKKIVFHRIYNNI